MGTMIHNILLTRFQGKLCLLTWDGVQKNPYHRRHRQEEERRMTRTFPPLSDDPGASLHSPHPFLSRMLCDPSVFYCICLKYKTRSKEEDERKVCIVIQSFVSRRPNHHSSHSSDREKHHTLLTLKRRKNVVYDVTTSCLGSMRAVHSPTWSQNERTRTQS